MLTVNARAFGLPIYQYIFDMAHRSHSYAVIKLALVYVSGSGLRMPITPSAPPML